jgi:CPA2 family monovalent cation:H+ antiporter-2
MHETTTVLLIEVGALLFLLGLLGRLSRRFGLSPIPFYLLAGLAFGQGGACSRSTRARSSSRSAPRSA